MSKKCIYFILSFTLFAVTCAEAQNGPIYGKRGEKLDHYLTRLVPFGFQGAVLVSEGEEILLNRGYGEANPTRGIPNTPETVFSMGSIVKPFTACLIMRLVQENRLSLKNGIGDFFEDVSPDKRDITIHQLLSHSSGLPGAIAQDTENTSEKTFLQKTWERPLAFLPGTHYQYSNVGYSLLAMIIERVTNKKYEEFLYETILKPAGMKDTGYTLPGWSPEHLAHNIFEGHDNGTFLQRKYYPTWNLIGNGGMLTTTGDMYRFYKFIKGNRLLTEDTKERMFRPVFMEDAYGWVNMDDGRLIQHDGGSMDGNGAVFKWYPGDDVFIMIFTNATINGVPGFMTVQNQIEALVFGEDAPMPPEITPCDGFEAEKMIGTYLLPSGARFAVKASRRGLIYTAISQDAVCLIYGGGRCEPGAISEWNDLLKSIFEVKMQEGDFSGLAMISDNPDRLKEILQREMDMEGYRDPAFRVLYTIPMDEGRRKTIVAVSINGFSGECMRFHLIFRDNKFAGLGVDFGSTEPPAMPFIAVSETALTGFDFRTGRSVEFKISTGRDGHIAQVKIDDQPWIAVKRADDPR